MQVEGQPIAAGTYGLHMILKENEPWTIIFSNISTSWGSYFYDEKEDALRVEVQPKESAYTEWLTYEFVDRKPESTTVALKWENLMVPFTITVPDVKELYVENMRHELQSSPGFTYQAWASAANYCAQNDVNLNEALVWADNAISAPFIGQENFTTLQTKATVLSALERESEADEVMRKAIQHPTANVQQIHAYGRSLIDAKKPEKAMEVFQMNKKMHPEDAFTTAVGLARGYAALGDTKKAIKNWELALENLPEEQKPNLPYYEAEIKKLKGEDEGEVGK
jgi:tetratricopeptide (TPR) repeat protein